MSGSKQAVISATNVKINHLPTKLTIDTGKNTLKLKDGIITVEVKDNSNVAFVCQRHCAQVLISELG